MFIDPGNVGFALDGQIVLRWRFLFPAVFLACRGGLGKRGNIPSGETGTPRRSRGAGRPEFCKETLPSETEGAGKTGCALHPRSHVRVCKQECAHEHTGSAENTRPS